MIVVNHFDYKEVVRKLRTELIINQKTLVWDFPDFII